MPKRHTRFDFGTIVSEINAGKKAHFIHTQTSNFLVVAVWVDVAVAGTRRSSTPRASLILFRANEKQQKKNTVEKIQSANSTIHIIRFDT